MVAIWGSVFSPLRYATTTKKLPAVGEIFEVFMFFRGFSRFAKKSVGFFFVAYLRGAKKMEFFFHPCLKSLKNIMLLSSLSPSLLVH